MKKLALALALLLCTHSAGAADLSLAPTNREVSDRLQLHLDRVESNAYARRIVDGVVFLALGVGFGVGAIVSSHSNDNDTRANGPTVYGITGGILAAGGTLILAFPAEGETIPERFRQMPQTSDEEIRARILRGEAELTHLADSARNSRLWGSGSLIALGVAGGVLYSASSDHAGNAFLLYEGAILAGFGVLGFFRESVPEQQLREYKDWRNVNKAGMISMLRLGIFPTLNGGAGLAISGKF